MYEDYHLSTLQLQEPVSYFFVQFPLYFDSISWALVGYVPSWSVVRPTDHTSIHHALYILLHKQIRLCIRLPDVVSTGPVEERKAICFLNGSQQIPFPAKSQASKSQDPFLISGPVVPQSIGGDTLVSQYCILSRLAEAGKEYFSVRLFGFLSPSALQVSVARRGALFPPDPKALPRRWE